MEKKRKHVDRINMISRIGVLKNIKTKHLVNPVDPV